MRDKISAWFRSKSVALGEEVFRALVTTLSLGVGFVIFNDYIAPPPNLTGRWEFTLVYEHTARPSFKDLQVTYQVLLIQKGLELHGTGEKVSACSPESGLETYSGAKRINIMINGSIKRNYLSKNKLVLHYIEEGKLRNSSTVQRLELHGQKAMSGRFWTTIADTIGSVHWERVETEKEGLR